MNAAAIAVIIKWETQDAILAEMLYKQGAIKFGSFELKNPDLSPSPIYIDLRTKENPKPGPLRDEDMEEIAQELLRVVSLSGLEYDFVCGIPNAGEPMAEAFRNLLQEGDRYRAQLKKKGSGDSRRIGGFKKFTRGRAKNNAKRVLIVDDVISGADTKLEAVKAVEEAGYKVAGLINAVDREQGGTEYLESFGLKVLCWKKLSELLRFYYLLGPISWNKKEEILEYIERTKPKIAPN